MNLNVVSLETALIAHGGLRQGAPILGILVAVVALPVLWAVIAPSPESMGLHPDGADDATATARKEGAASGQYKVWTRAEAARLTNIRAAGNRKAGTPGPEGSTGKLASAELNKDIYDFCMSLMCADAMLYGDYTMHRPETAMAGMSRKPP